MSADSMDPAVHQLDQMHALYRQGGRERHLAPHIVYSDPTCPHAGCQQRIQAIDFRLEAHGKGVYDELIRAWWDDTGFVGRCPGCNRWIHFTIRAKRAVTAEEAARLPRLPDDWHVAAIIL